MDTTRVISSRPGWAIGQISLVEMLTEVEDYAAALIESLETKVCRLSIGLCALSHQRGRNARAEHCAGTVLVMLECFRRGGA